MKVSTSRWAKEMARHHKLPTLMSLSELGETLKQSKDRTKETVLSFSPIFCLITLNIYFIYFFK